MLGLEWWHWILLGPGAFVIMTLTISVLGIIEYIYAKIEFSEKEK